MVMHFLKLLLAMEVVEILWNRNGGTLILRGYVTG